MAVTDADLLDAVKQALQKAPDVVMEPWWSSVAKAANLEAYNAVVAAMTTKGYLLTPQIAAWDQFDDFVRLYGVWRAINQAATNQPDQYSKESLKAVDPREALKVAVVIVDGVFQPPGLTTILTTPSGTVNQVTVGPEDGSTSMFGVPIDPDDPRTGEVVRF